MPQFFDHRNCPYANRCDKYTEFTLRNDRKDERLRQVLAENAKLKARNAELEALVAGGASDAPDSDASGEDVRPFGISTPSSKLPFKPGSTEEARRRRGGRPKGHPGAGRRSFTEETADRVEDVPCETDECPCCHAKLVEIEPQTRSVIEAEPVRHYRKLIRLGRRLCPECGRSFSARAKGVLSNVMFGNRIGAQMAFDRFCNGLTAGCTVRRLDVPRSATFSYLDALARRLKPAVDRLLEEYRADPHKHADETPWRKDGKNGYVWGFFTQDISIYRCRETRASSVPLDVFGKGKCVGVLTVDRYSGYPASWKGRIQYCYEHLKRDGLKAIEKGIGRPKDRARVEGVVACLRGAMRLQSRFDGRDVRAYRREARAIKKRIMDLTREKARDPVAESYLCIFRSHPERLYHWAMDPWTACQNNLAERRIRPLVIARKISFGSQSDRGLETREILMTVCDTLAQRHDDPVEVLRQALDKLAEDPSRDIGELLFPKR